MTLTQSGEDIAGTGSFTSPVGSGPFTVTGRVTGLDVELRIISETLRSTTYLARVAGP